MPNATWPASLPQRPDIEGFEIRAPDNAIIASPAEAGRGKRRRRSTASELPCSFTFTMVLSQRETFLTFHRDTLDAGVLPFDWPEPATGAAATWLFDPRAPYRIAPQGQGRWKVSIQVARQIG